MQCSEENGEKLINERLIVCNQYEMMKRGNTREINSTAEEK